MARNGTSAAPCLLVGVVAGVAVGLLSSRPVRDFIAFAKDSYKEVRKVVWPTRKETIQTTLVVFGFVFVDGCRFSGLATNPEWVIFSAILGWK